MARQQVVSYTYMCDVCGAEIPESDADNASRKVSWGGADYMVDVCSTHQGELTETLDKLKGFVDAGRRNVASRRRRAAAAGTTTTATATAAPGSPRGRSGRATGSTGSGRSDLGAIRAWAQANGYQLGDRGRIAATIVAAYDAAQELAGAPSAPAPKRRARKSAPAAAPAPTDDQDVEPWRALAMEKSGPSA